MRAPLWFVLLAGCGGGAPLLHDAHVLPPGTTRMGAGLSGTFATGDASRAVREAREAGLPASDAAAAPGAAAAIGIGPGTASWISGRVGIPGDNEAGLTFAGRTLHIDARHAFQDESTAFSIGPAMSVSTGPLDVSSGVPSVEVTARKLGADLPLLLGWKSTAGIVSGWVGLRTGFESTTGSITLGLPYPQRSGDLDLLRWYAGGIIGLSFGFRHVHAALELDASYNHVAGTLAGTRATTTGVTLTPAAALLFTF